MCGIATRSHRLGSGAASHTSVVWTAENRLRHLPVMDDGRLLGLISIGDLVKGLISDQKFIIQQLEHYI
jgi:CBS domain-containing protein